MWAKEDGIDGLTNDTTTNVTLILSVVSSRKELEALKGKPKHSIYVMSLDSDTSLLVCW